MSPKTLQNVKAVIFDYGGTLDTKARPWASVQWEAYRHANFPIDEDTFQKACTFAENALIKAPIVKPTDDFYHLMLKKIEQQIAYLEFKHILHISALQQQALLYDIAGYCNSLALKNMETTREVLATLRQKYPLVLVSNFFGNIHAVLSTFGLDGVFTHIVESSVVGVRKPDPAIYRLGVEATGFKPEEVVVVANSYKKDMEPASSLGCRTIWFKGEGQETPADYDPAKVCAIITDLRQVLDYLA